MYIWPKLCIPFKIILLIMAPRESWVIVSWDEVLSNFTLWVEYGVAWVVIVSIAKKLALFSGNLH